MPIARSVKTAAPGGRFAFRSALAFTVVAHLAGTALAADPLPRVVREAVVLEPVGRAGRNTVFTDAWEKLRVEGRAPAPRAGLEVAGPGGTNRTWTAATPDADGWFTGPALRGGHLAFTHVAASDGVAVLVAAGDGVGFVNGVPRAGDVYQYGYVRLPVPLHAGTNEFLFTVPRGRFRAELLPVTPDTWLQTADATLPDLRVGEAADTWGAVVVGNPTLNWARDLRLEATVAGRTTVTPVPAVPPFGVMKSPFALRAAATSAPGDVPLQLRLSRTAGGGEVATQKLGLRSRRAGETFKRTFRSAIDDSVQYFGVNPASSPRPPGGHALFLSLHGASVEAIGQADAYAPKRWGTLVSPTNRRPYGFDWEDWGRLDALEVLEHATAEFQPDPARVYLTGHSMGGHGTWNFGATFPDRFAAIAPSAGWISFWSYAGSTRFTNATPVEQLLLRASAGGDTLAMSTNYLQQGVYIIHGDADDNVPVTEARTMRAHLAGFHRDVDWHEQPGAGHWWDDSDEPGAACVDWPPLFDFFARHRRADAAEVRRVDFTTVNPGISATDRWLTIAQQEHSLVASRANVLWDPGLRRFTGTTVNVRRMAVDVPVPADGTAANVGFDFDGQKFLTATSQPRIWLVRREGRWAVGGPVPTVEKGPHRAGSFKDAFRHRMIFVYGTRGTAEENEWSWQRARFDSEAFWYRGNASIELVADRDFDPARYPDRGVILYGNRDSNGAWEGLLADSPVQVGRSGVTVDGRVVARDDLACLFLRPRRDSARACVAVVSGTGMRGLRLTTRLPYIMAGTGYPDCLVLGADTLERGTAGIVTAGFFGPDWTVAAGDFAWAE